MMNLYFVQPSRPRLRLGYYQISELGLPAEQSFYLNHLASEPLPFCCGFKFWLISFVTAGLAETLLGPILILFSSRKPRADCPRNRLQRKWLPQVDSCGSHGWPTLGCSSCSHKVTLFSLAAGPRMHEWKPHVL